MGGDIHQANNRWIGARFRNYGSPIAVRDKDARSILQGEDALQAATSSWKDVSGSWTMLTL